MNIRLPFLLLFLLPAVISFSQPRETWIFLKSGKSTFTIKSEKCSYIKLTFNQEGDSLRYFTTSIQGQLVSATPTDITLIPASSQTMKVSHDCFRQRTETWYPQKSEPVVFPADKINVLSYQSNAASNGLAVGGALIIIGSLVTGIIAPLTSINFKTGKINSRQYAAIAAAGLGLGIISIPICILSVDKVFNLKASKNSKRETWEIVQ